MPVASRPGRRARRWPRRRHPARARPAVTTSTRSRPTSRALCRRSRHAGAARRLAFGAHTRSRLSWLSPATIWSSSTTALCIRPRNVSPVSSAALTSFSATPGAAMSPEHHRDLGALPEFVDQRLRLLGRFGPAVEHDPAGAAVDQPPGHGQTEPTQTTGENVGAVRPDDRLGLGRAECRAGKPLRRNAFRRASAMTSSPVSPNSVAQRWRRAVALQVHQRGA